MERPASTAPGRSLEAGGNAGPRWMVAPRPSAVPGAGDRTRPTGRLHAEEEPAGSSSAYRALARAAAAGGRALSDPAGTLVSQAYLPDRRPAGSSRSARI